jgi:hypothetical protein
VLTLHDAVSVYVLQHHVTRQLQTSPYQNLTPYCIGPALLVKCAPTLDT